MISGCKAADIGYCLNVPDENACHVMHPLRVDINIRYFGWLFTTDGESSAFSIKVTEIHSDPQRSTTIHIAKIQLLQQFRYAFFHATWKRIYDDDSIQPSAQLRNEVCSMR
jgi:hypothetical protein